MRRAGFSKPPRRRARGTVRASYRHAAREVYGLRWRDLDLDRRRLTVNQVVAKTRRKKGDACARIEFGAPKTDKSRRTLDFPPFVATLLAEHRSEVHELRRFAGDRWQDHGLVFPSQVGTALEERNVLRRFQKICEGIGLPRLRLYDLRHTHASLLINEGVARSASPSGSAIRRSS